MLYRGLDMLCLEIEEGNGRSASNEGVVMCHNGSISLYLGTRKVSSKLPLYLKSQGQGYLSEPLGFEASDQLTAVEVFLPQFAVRSVVEQE